jgi:DNA repair exonuclease SbcCD ATPase subunit
MTTMIMEELFQHLETRIKTLVDQQRQLEQVNQQLQQGKVMLMREKDTLQESQKKAISQIESLVSKLKTIEIPL